MAKEIRKKNIPQKQDNSKQTLYYILCVVFILVGVITVYKMKWVGDDIFITLKYVENFLLGNGLVYNIGERVEGYTDFLWAMILAFFQWLKFDPVESANTIGILSYAGVLILFSRVSFLLNKKFQHRYYLPFTLIALALNYDFAVWGTSGLETAFYTLLLCGAFVIYFFSSMQRKKRLFLTGLLMCFAVMTRPDSMLFVMYANVLLLFRNIVLRIKFKELFTEQLIFASSVILIYIPYFIWRYQYYGFIFPNTYYDKLGYEVFFSRGFLYLWLYVKCHFTTFLFFLFIPVLAKSFASMKETKYKQLQDVMMNRDLSAFYAAVFGVLGYLILFVAKVGGDFMYARFVVPCMPLIYFVIEYSVNVVMKKKSVPVVFIVVILLSFAET